MIGMILIGLILVGIIVYAVRNNPRRDSVKNTQVNDALNILNLRFAKGEINEEEYKIKKDLLTR